MTIRSLLCWNSATVDDELVATVSQHDGRLENHSGASFPSVSAALAAAVQWRRRIGETMPCLTLTVSDSDGYAGVHSALDVLGAVAARGERGEILATEIVRLLAPTPTSGRWTAIESTDPGTWYRLQLTHIPSPTRVVVAEDAAIIRAGIVVLLENGGMRVVGQAASRDELLAVVREQRPTLLVTDVRMPPAQSDEGLSAAAVLRREQPDLAVLVLSQHVQASSAAALLNGQTSGIGYLLKERVAALDEFLAAARQVAAGGTVIDPLVTADLMSRRTTPDRLSRLADREREVLQLMAQGLSNAAIASRLYLSARTVETHVSSIMNKLDLSEDPAGNRRVQAVVRWLDQS